AAAWWIESVRAARRADQHADELKREAEHKEREADLRARQLATERDVLAALNEVQVLREEGWKQADDPPRWALTLAVAGSSLKRPRALLNAGEPTDALRARLAAKEAELAGDERDRALLAELDRVADDNEIRFLIPVTLSRLTSRRFTTAF